VVKYEYEITYPKIGDGVGTWHTFVVSSSYSGVFNQVEGTHTYRVRAYDAENNASAWSNSCSITYDKTLPTSEITYPFNSNSDNKIQYTYIWNGKVEGVSADILSGVDHVELSIYRSLLDLYWNGSNWVHGSEIDTRVIAVGTTSWEYQFNNQPPLGRFRIIAHAVDKAGNIENSAIIEFENAVPETILAPTLVSTLKINLSSSPASHKINLEITNIFSPLDYEIVYTGNGMEKGISGHIDSDEILDSKYSKDFYLGTCSASENCTPEVVEKGSTIFVDLIGSETIRQTFTY
jgi:hypothetical protein